MSSNARPPALRDRSFGSRSVVRRMLFLVAVNPSSRKVLVVALVALGALAGCSGGNPLQVGRDGGSAGQSGGGAGGNDAAVTCEGLSEGMCGATPGCQQLYCPTCSGGRIFAGCGVPGGAGAACPLDDCLAPCANLRDETSCKARPDCKPLSCSDCRGGQTFAGCDVPGGAGVACGPCPPRTCNTLDETSCKTRSDCHPGYCADCSGTQKFTLCVGPNEAVACPAYACPIMPAPCAKLSEATCLGRGDCQAEYCNGCQGRTFAGCGDPGAGVTCPVDPPGCPPVACANVTDQLSCDARTDCHSVFGDLGICDCIAAGCCIGFTRCADGAKATCKGAPVCQIPPPNCGPAYVASHNVMCFDGCVRPTECAP
jgi:hypothetical protein